MYDFLLYVQVAPLVFAKLYFPSSDFSLDQLLRQTDDNLKKGFRAINMKVGRSRLSEDLEQVRAMRDHLGADFPLMVGYGRLQ
jgi:L-alanine-DL-glutamate epimerase-like enolase superfamily enzyme